MKNLKWIVLGIALLSLTVFAVAGSFADESSDGKYLYIVQSELERSGSELTEAQKDKILLPGIYDDILLQNTSLYDADFSVVDKKGNTLGHAIDTDHQMYTAANALDHIVVVTNTGNVSGYVRTWVAFEMGDLSEEEFNASLLLNRNFTDWTWTSFEYGVQIDGERYAVVCAEYNGALTAGTTTEPSLLQVMLSKSVSEDISERLDGNGDGKFEIKAASRTVSDQGAWSGITHPW